MRLYGLAGLLGVVAFASSLMVLHLFGPDIDWPRHYVSAFANGRLGSVFVFGAAVHGLGNLALSAGLRRSLAPGAVRAAAVLLLGLAAVGIFTAALFPTDASGQAVTLVGLVHRLVAAASFPLELLALFLFSAAFAASPRWRRWAGLSLAWAVVAAVAVAGLLFAVLWNHVPGLAERLALASFLVWELGTSLELARSRSSDALPARRGDEASQVRANRTRFWRKAVR